MILRPILEDALLGPLRELFPDAEGSDLLLFGEKADISSPLPQKNGIDIAPAAVYNILKEVSLGTVPLLSDVRIENGYLNMTIGDEALAMICGALSQFHEPSRAEVIDIDPFGREFIRARLLDVWFERGDGDFSPPEDPLMRRAFWNVLAADSPSSLTVALKRCGIALREDRKSPRLCGKAAYYMAAALENR